MHNLLDAVRSFVEEEGRLNDCLSHLRIKPAFRSQLLICEPQRSYTRQQLIDAFGAPVSRSATEAQSAPPDAGGMDQVVLGQAMQIAGKVVERVSRNTTRGRHRQALAVGLECRKQALPKIGAAEAARLFYEYAPESDSDGHPRPLTPQEVSSAVLHAYEEGVVFERKRKLSDFILSGGELPWLDIPPRKMIIEPFMTERSLGMIYAKRGVGKTWLALDLAHACATVTKFLEWPVNGPHRVLYIDGEMPLADLKERILQLCGATPPENLMLFPSERLFLESRPLRINDTDDQQRILEGLDDLETSGKRPDVLVFDNLSSLTSGMDENSNSDLDTFLAWLVQLRHRGYAVVVVHHAGKNGQQRGASRHEDLLDTSIKLEELPPEARIGLLGAAFELIFDKVRGRRPVLDRLIATLIGSDTGGVTWAIGPLKPPTKEMEALQRIVSSEPNSQKELAKALGVSAPRISELVRKLRAGGFLGGSGLMPTSKGLAMAERLGASQMPH